HRATTPVPAEDEVGGPASEAGPRPGEPSKLSYLRVAPPLSNGGHCADRRRGVERPQPVEVPVPAKPALAGAAAPTLADCLGVSWGNDLAREYRTLFMQESIAQKRCCVSSPRWLWWEF